MYTTSTTPIKRTRVRSDRLTHGIEVPLPVLTAIERRYVHANRVEEMARAARRAAVTDAVLSAAFGDSVAA